MRIPTLAATAAVFATFAVAQERPAGDGPSRFRYLFEDGQVWITTREGAEEPLEPVAVWSLANEDAMQVVVGPVMFPFMIFPGGTDVVSLADADRFFGRLETPDAELLQIVMRPAADEDPAWVGKRRILAVRAAGARGLKPMLGVFDRVLSEEGLDPNLRRAILDVRAELRGEAPPEHPAPDLMPLAELLQQAPADSTVVGVADQWRMPSAGAIGRFAWLTHPVWDMSFRFLFDGSELDLDLMQARSRETPGLIGWEFARIFGNQRVVRSAVAVAMATADFSKEPEFAILYEGDFDWTGLPDRLSQASIPNRVDEAGRVVIEASNLHAIFDSRFVRLSNEAPKTPMTAEAAAAWAERIGTGGAPLVVARTDDFEFPEMGDLPFVPRRIELTVPRGDIAPFELVLTLDSTAAAEAAESLAKGAPRMLEMQAEELAALDPVVDWVNGLEVVRDGTRLTLRLGAREFTTDSVLREMRSAGIFER